MSYESAIVANAVLYRAKTRGLSVDHMKLQKLVFFTHAWCLALHGRPAVTEQPEAWTYGPVFDQLYHKLKNYGRAPIQDYVKSVDPATNTYVERIPTSEDTQFWNVLDQVMDRYGNMSALQLSTLSHEPGGPWDIARAERNARIPNEAIRTHYRRQLHGQATTGRN